MNRRHFLKGLLGTGTLFYLEPSKFIFDMGANLYKPKLYMHKGIIFNGVTHIEITFATPIEIAHGATLDFNNVIYDYSHWK